MRTSLIQLNLTARAERGEHSDALTRRNIHDISEVMELPSMCLG